MPDIEKQKLPCELCHSAKAHQYVEYRLNSPGVPAEEIHRRMCARCARQSRGRVQPETHRQNSDACTREEFIALMDRFWQESGVAEICARCHQQGTGCCPPMCRYLSEAGCRRKNVFCTSFICSALLNAIAECNAETGRLLKWIKQNPGVVEFRIYEMVSRVPAADRGTVRPLSLPVLYPGKIKLNGQAMVDSLAKLSDEVLEIRRQWQAEEQRPFLA
jgi:hypothetical protein